MPRATIRHACNANAIDDDGSTLIFYYTARYARLASSCDAAVCRSREYNAHTMYIRRTIRYSRRNARAAIYALDLVDAAANATTAWLRGTIHMCAMLAMLLARERNVSQHAMSHY